MILDESDFNFKKLITEVVLLILFKIMKIINQDFEIIIDLELQRTSIYLFILNIFQIALQMALFLHQKDIKKLT